MHVREVPLKFRCHELADASGDEPRHCGACDRDVIALSTRTAAEVRRLQKRARAGERICVRVVVGDEGLVKLRVGDAGQVRGVSVEESTLADPVVADCLKHEAAGWAFKTGRNATVVYPFVFRPQ